MYSKPFFLVLTLFLLKTLVQCHRFKRIVASYDVQITKHPYMVSLHVHRNTTSDTAFTGILVTPEWLLTDSSNIGQALYRYYGATMSPVDIVAGTNDQCPKANDTVSKWAKHVQLNSTGEWWEDKSVEMTAVNFKPAFPTNNPKIQPAKLPPRKDFIKSCSKVEILGWGSVTLPHERIIFSRPLRLSRAKIVLCDEGTQQNMFCLRLYRNGQVFCDDKDKGMAVVCNGTVIGITLKMYNGPVGDKTVNVGYGKCEKYFFANDIAQYMTWIHATTGAKVAFQSKPNYAKLKYSAKQKKQKEQAEKKREKKRMRDLGLTVEGDDDEEDETSTVSLGTTFRNTLYTDFLLQSVVCLIFVIFYLY